MGRILGVVLLAAGLLIGMGSDAARASSPRTLELPGDAGDPFVPESITAAPNGALFVSSLTTGDIVRFAPGSPTSTTFVTGVNVGTAGVMADPDRNLLWACAVDIISGTPSALRAFDLRTGARVASYPIPNGGLCADIALARGDVYVTDTLLGRILRLSRVRGGTLEVWSADRKLAGGGSCRSTASRSTDAGRCTRPTTAPASCSPSRSGPAARPSEPSRSSSTADDDDIPDGIRWRDGYLYVAQNAAGCHA